MLLMIDNYDSFTYNLVQYFGELGQEVKVFRNDEISVEDVQEFKPKNIWLFLPDLVLQNRLGGFSRAYKNFPKGKFPILGVCLGHKAIGEAFGGKIMSSSRSNAWETFKN